MHQLTICALVKANKAQIYQTGKEQHTNRHWIYRCHTHLSFSVSLWVFSNQQILGYSSWHIKLKCIVYNKVIFIYPKCYNWSIDQKQEWKIWNFHSKQKSTISYFLKYICHVQYIGKISGFFPGFTFLSLFSFYRRCLISYCMLQIFFSTDNTEKVQSYAVTQVTMQNHVTMNLFPIFLM